MYCLKLINSKHSILYIHQIHVLRIKMENNNKLELSHSVFIFDNQTRICKNNLTEKY